ncbi:DNA polymerase III subunit chi [Candidatus Liberibacter africanus]|uniref:DNA polymerase III subunit chi n=1 Tax=Candidatus Liberibacter africanus PTSAPSY TaxID=1277257 RepID=A0A0G3I272_LIBAF|nr:DNA polymerase III subunit chi [Candidatus Liberibacter africanus]AKK19944.1 DNA polymerase III subunit chi [Candidatus Liberibacter africanus PTSAPSY]QTP63784.1 DNA polymerase III subunit chi [Candidatus Liberibacter africanus]
MSAFLFYRFKNDWQDDLSFLLQGEYENGQRISIQFGSERMRDAFNEYLWVWKADSFLPHGVDVGDEEVFSSFQPVLLTISSLNANSSSIRFFVDRASFQMRDVDLYKKLVFIINTDDQESLEWGRENWRNLKNRGYSLDAL